VAIETHIAPWWWGSGGDGTGESWTPHIPLRTAGKRRRCPMPLVTRGAGEYALVLKCFAVRVCEYLRIGRRWIAHLDRCLRTRRNLSRWERMGQQLGIGGGGSGGRCRCSQKEHLRIGRRWIAYFDRCLRTRKSPISHGGSRGTHYALGQ
jgi:hypothetical protein